MQLISAVFTKRFAAEHCKDAVLSHGRVLPGELCRPAMHQCNSVTKGLQQCSPQTLVMFTNPLASDLTTSPLNTPENSWSPMMEGSNEKSHLTSENPFQSIYCLACVLVLCTCYHPPTKYYCGTKTDPPLQGNMRCETWCRSCRVGTLRGTLAPVTTPSPPCSPHSTRSSRSILSSPGDQNDKTKITRMTG